MTFSEPIADIAHHRPRRARPDKCGSSAVVGWPYTESVYVELEDARATRCRPKSPLSKSGATTHPASRMSLTAERKNLVGPKVTFSTQFAEPVVAPRAIEAVIGTSSTSLSDGFLYPRVFQDRSSAPLWGRRTRP